ncbi:GTP cyclohydrolase I, partial [Parvimonas micra]
VGELTKGLNYDFFPKMTATPNGHEVLDEDAFTDYVTDRQGAWGNEKSQAEILAMESTVERKIELTSTVGAYDQMVLVDAIQTVSLCEHHLQTIDGFTHIAYIPGKKVLGLSKFARVVEFFAARPQIQEKFTEQVFAALSFVLETDDIAVVCKAKHFCMHARGAKQHNSLTTTNKMGGLFMTNDALRKEFFDG